MTVLRHQLLGIDSNPVAGHTASVMAYQPEAPAKGYRRTTVVNAVSDDDGFLEWKLPRPKTGVTKPVYVVTGIEAQQVLVTVPTSVSTATVAETRTGTLPLPPGAQNGTDLVTEGELATRLAGLTPVLPARLSEEALRAAFARGLDVTNLAGLSRWAEARGNALIRPVTITTLGDSISWGIGANDANGATTAPENAIYRQRAWGVQLRKRLNAMFGATDAEGWVGLTPGWDAGTLTLTSANRSTSIGPFGAMGGDKGGYASGSTTAISMPAASTNLGKFTEIDVWYWGPDSGVATPAVPQVTIDGSARNTPSGVVTTGNLLKATVTGLADTAHDVVIGLSSADQAAGGRQIYVFAVTVRRDSKGFVLNRISVPGAETAHLSGASAGFTAQQQQRNIDSAVMRGYSDLLIVALGANDQSSQVALATYKANIQRVIDAQVAAGGCVLLLGEPPRPIPTGALTEDMYRLTMRELALSNTHVAYTDIRDVMGDRTTLFARGLIPVSGTIHPTAKGHGVMANAVTDLLTLPRYV